ncbi:hypothetical protein ASC80_03660 [Afipia sp. Root123D2]|nr:hypothetical protein ASC80_03660 [Afipia sp. Root123D2]
MVMTTTPKAYGPRRDIPAHRLAPWAARHRPSRSREGGGVSPSSGDGPKGRSPEVFAQQAVKTIACGTPDVFGVFVVTMLVCFLLLRTRLRMRRASGVPRALM